MSAVREVYSVSQHMWCRNGKQKLERKKDKKGNEKNGAEDDLILPCSF